MLEELMRDIRQDLSASHRFHFVIFFVASGPQQTEHDNVLFREKMPQMHVAKLMGSKDPASKSSRACMVPDNCDAGAAQVRLRRGA